MTYIVRIKSSAKSDLKKIYRSNLKDQFMDIMNTLKNDPFENTQSLEKLQPPSANIYSRRINSQHRVVYDIDKDNKIVSVYSAWTHYE